MGSIIRGNRFIKFNDAAEQYIVPQHVEYIEDLAFADSDQLFSLTIPDTVSEIGNYAFANCGSLREINLPQKVDRIGTGLFQKCWNLKAVSFPEGLTILGGEMFEGCHSLTSLTLPATLESVERTAFSHCRSLKKISVDPQQIHILPASARYLAVLTYMEEPSDEAGKTIINQYVREKKYSFMDLAINRRSTDAVKYMLEHDLIDPDTIRDFLDKSVKGGRVEIAALLLNAINHNNGNRIDPVLNGDPFA